MIQGLGLITRFGYGFLYVPASTFGYLYLETELQAITATTPAEIPFLGLQIPQLVFSTPTSHLPIYAALALFGGIWLHLYSIVVFGHEGPSQNPKNKGVSIRMMASLCFGVSPEDLPKTGSTVLLGLAAIKHLNWWSPIRMLVFIPAGLFKPLMYLSAWLIITGVPLNSLKLAGGILILANATFVIRDQLDRFFPNFVPEEAVGRLDQTEYKISAEKKREVDSESGE